MAVLTSTNNLCFRAKIRKNVYPCIPQFYFMKVGCEGYKLQGCVIMVIDPLVSTFRSHLFSSKIMVGEFSEKKIYALFKSCFNIFRCQPYFLLRNCCNTCFFVL